MDKISKICGDKPMIIFLSCTSKKKNYKCPAKELYSASQWFRRGYEYAKKLNPRKIYILSAKYGLLEEEDIIGPYNQSLIKEKDAEIRKWSMMVLRQIIKKNIPQNEKIIFLCGKNYRKYLQRYFINSTAPLSHMGIGKQLAFFKKEVNL